MNDQLLAAAGAGDNARIAALLHQGASLNYVGATGPPLNYRGTALLAAVSNRQLSTVKFLLARRATVTPDLLLVTSKLLTWTSTRQAEYEEVASVLIDHGADVNAIAEWESAGSQYTPLVMAARGGSLRLVKELLAHGAGIEREGIRSPIEEAEEQGYPEVVRLLRRAARRRHR